MMDKPTTSGEGEVIYDEQIAPMLLEVARKCHEHGFSLVARVEWWPGESGITADGDMKISVGQAMAYMAAMARGNIDAMLIPLVRDYNVEQSMFLHTYNKHPPAAGG